jgi:hypothetical protein
MCGVEHFVDDDSGYSDWLARHPDDFVINTGRTPTAAYLVMHRAGCGTISGRPASGATFTAGEYAKVCGRRDELEAFARELGGHPQPCGLCLGRLDQPQPPTADRGKYHPLGEHLAGRSDSKVRMTFAEVEELVGRLPDSAHLHRAWWGNNGSNVEARAWLDAGWHVVSVNQTAGEVVFARGLPRQVRNSGRTVIDRLVPYIDARVSTSLVARAEVLGLDSSKLSRLVAELNDNYSRGNAYAAHALLRSLLDHVPPLLGCGDFKAAANNYPWSRTDKSYAHRLLDFKLQADDALHRQISRRPDRLDVDDMPPKIWINRILQECADSRHGSSA